MSSFKYIPSWKQVQGKITQTEKGIMVHPHDLISLVQKKKGPEQAGKLAVKLLTNKYNKILDILEGQLDTHLLVGCFDKTSFKGRITPSFLIYFY